MFLSIVFTPNSNLNHTATKAAPRGETDLFFSKKPPFVTVHFLALTTLMYMNLKRVAYGYKKIIVVININFVEKKFLPNLT